MLKRSTLQSGGPAVLANGTVIGLRLPGVSPSLLSTVLATTSDSKLSCMCWPRKEVRCSSSMRSLSSSSSGSQVPSMNHMPRMTGMQSCSVEGGREGETSERRQVRGASGKERGEMLPSRVGGFLFREARMGGQPIYIYSFSRRPYQERLRVSTETFPPEASRGKCLAREHNVIWHSRESNWQPSDYKPDSLTSQPPDSRLTPNTGKWASGWFLCGSARKSNPTERSL